MVFRYARHTNNLEKIKVFYTNVLQLELIGSFEEHEGYNGFFLGKTGEDWHLEFTATEELVKHQFNEDDLLVFYPKTKKEYQSIVASIQKQGVSTLEAKNPYWNRHGVLVKDPDGMGVVISDLKIEK